MHIHERNAERNRLNGLMLKSPMKVYAEAETLDIGVLMGGTLAVKSVRHAFSVLEQLRAKGR